MIDGDHPIPLPDKWSDLTASSTRFGIMYQLFEIAHWNEARFSQKSGQHLKSICETFFDDYMFFDNPESMIGQSFYHEELELVKSFGRKLKVFLDEYDINFGIKENYYKLFENRDFYMPIEISQSASSLLDLMILRGDPEIEKYVS